MALGLTEAVIALVAIGILIGAPSWVKKATQAWADSRKIVNEANAEEKK